MTIQWKFSSVYGMKVLMFLIYKNFQNNAVMDYSNLLEMLQVKVIYILVSVYVFFADTLHQLYQFYRIKDDLLKFSNTTFKLSACLKIESLYEPNEYIDLQSRLDGSERSENASEYEDKI